MMGLADRLVRLHQLLRDAGFGVGVDERIACECVLGRLQSRDIDVENAADLVRYLAPIYCASPEQQRTFPALLEQSWCTPIALEKSAEGTTKDLGSAASVARPTKHVATERPSNSSLWRRLRELSAALLERWRTAAALVAAILIVLLLYVFFGLRNPPRVSGAMHLSAATIFLVFSPFGLAGLWWLYWAAARRLWFSVLPERTAPGVRELSAQARNALAPGLGWSVMGHELRRRQRVIPGPLDVEESLKSFFGGTGPPRLVFGNLVEPKYVVLVEELSQADHLARLGEEFLLSLERCEVELTRFYFSGTPPRCFGPAARNTPRRQGLPSMALEEVLAQLDDDRLLVMGDGRSMFNAVTGGLEPWVEWLLTQTRQPVLMTPLPRSGWGRREWALSRLGFTVLPLDTTGVAHLVEHYGNGTPASVLWDSDAMTEVPTAWHDEPQIWMMPIPPSQLSPQELSEDLRRELGEGTYRLLQGLCLYPEIHWGLTVRIGSEMLLRPEFAASLSQLASLPWFRQSYMPQWLRAEIVRDLPDEERHRVYRVIKCLLEAAKGDLSGDIPLRVRPPPIASWWDKFLRTQSSLRKLLEHPLASGSRMRRDAVFLSFMRNSSGVVSAVGQQRLRRLLFTEGVWWQGTRVLPVVLLALIAAAVLAGSQLSIWRGSPLPRLQGEPGQGTHASASTPRAGQPGDRPAPQVPRREARARVAERLPLILAAQLSFWLVLIFLYPRWTWVQSFFFWNKWTRRFLGLGYVGILITLVPWLRRRMFLPFRESLFPQGIRLQYNADGYFPDREVALETRRSAGRTCVPLKDVLAGTRGQVIVKGQSGLGKTELLLHLASLSREPVVFLRATDCRAGVVAAIRGKLPGQLRDKNYLQRLIYAGGLKVLIDGLNEAPPEARLAVTQFMEEFFQGDVILTTQPMGRENWEPPPPARVYTLQPLRVDQIEPFLLKQWGNLAASERRNREQSFSQEYYNYKEAVSEYMDAIRKDQEASATPDPRLVTLSNPMDAALAATLIARNEAPDTFDLVEERYRVMAQRWQQERRKLFPLHAFSERVYEWRVSGEPYINTYGFEEEVFALAEDRLMIRRADVITSEDGYYIVQRWLFRHERIMDFFLLPAFMNENKTPRRYEDRIDEYEPFMGVYELLSVRLPDDEEKRFHQRLIERAAETGRLDKLLHHYTLARRPRYRRNRG